MGTVRSFHCLQTLPGPKETDLGLVDYLNPGGRNCHPDLPADTLFGAAENEVIRKCLQAGAFAVG